MASRRDGAFLSLTALCSDREKSDARSGLAGPEPAELELLERVVGVPVVDHRLVIHGVLWRIRTSSPWRDLPSDYGHGKTVYNRHRRWSAEGTWATVLEEPRRGGDQNTEAGQSVQWSAGVEGQRIQRECRPAGAGALPGWPHHHGSRRC
ncbi:MAG: transposase [Pseudonocardiaceae bacterium]